MDEEQDTKSKDSDGSDDDGNQFAQFSSYNRFAGLASTKKKPQTATATTIPNFNFSRLLDQVPTSPRRAYVAERPGIMAQGGGNRAGGRWGKQPPAVSDNAAASGFSKSAASKPAAAEGAGFWASLDFGTGGGWQDTNVAEGAGESKIEDRGSTAAAAASISSLKLDDSGSDIASSRSSSQRVGPFNSKRLPQGSRGRSMKTNIQTGEDEETTRSCWSGGGAWGGVRCPFAVKSICLSCFKNGGNLVYQKGTYCGNRSANHTWELHKGYIIYDDAGKATVLRDLSPSISAIAGTKKPNVKMCWRVTRYNKCTFPNCGFAHSRMELKCWIWLLKHGKKLTEVAEGSPDNAIPAERRATARPTTAPSRAEAVLPPRFSSHGASWATSVAAALRPQPVRPTAASSFAASSRATAPGIPTQEFLAYLEEEIEEEPVAYYCYLCDKGVQDQAMLDDHFYTETCRNRSALMEGRTWKHRRPFGAPPFKLCDKHIHGGRCTYSKTTHNRCPYAHTTDELDEWNERLEFLKRAVARKANDAMIELKNNIKAAKKAGKSILTPCADDVDITCEGNCQAAMTEKGQPYIWRFSVLVTSETRLQRVMLLDHDTAMYFCLKSPFSSTRDQEVELGDVFADVDVDGYYEVIVEFVGSKTPQTFTQRVVFDFGRLPLVHRELVVHSGLDNTALVQQNSLRYYLKTNYLDQRWTPENAHIIWISKARSADRMDVASIVANLNFDINESNYFSLLKQWLFAEQYKRQSILDGLSFNKVQITVKEVVVNDDGQELYPAYGTLFAEVLLPERLSEDVDVITLLREDCKNAFVAPTNALPAVSKETMAATGGKRIVYEVDVVNKVNFNTDGVFSDRVHLRLSVLFVKHMNLRPGSKLTVDIQFNFADKQFHQWVRGLERLQGRHLGHLIFPDLLTYYPDYLTGKVIDNANAMVAAMNNGALVAQWKQQHNAEQRNVMGHIVSCAIDRKNWIPPLVVFGPFGTGKTRTLAAAAATLLMNSALGHTKILICTHANTTADMYIKLLLQHTRLAPGHLSSILWRVCHSRTTSETEDFVRRVFDQGQNRYRPERLTLSKLRQMRIVICTFSASVKLLKVLEENDEKENEKVAFTHIFIDEAAQALELETVLPLCLANRSTCIVVAGDHHQIRPPVYLPQAKELGRSYLERLYCYYDQQKSSMEKHISPAERAKYRIPSILFNKNYRCHPDILSFLSLEFYGDPNCLVSCAERYDNSLIKPLYFVTSESDETVGRNASILNLEEAKAVADQVEYLWCNWPRAWGEPNIGVAVPYKEQAAVIRGWLKDKRVPTRTRTGTTCVDVTRVIEMQGKEYSALIISTVRGPEQLVNAGSGNRARNLAFLDDPRLINTAMTRAKYTVIVVGHPVVLCTLGACRDIWYRYIQTCGRNGTLLPDSVKWPALDYKIGMYRAEFLNINTKDPAETTSADDLLVSQLTRKTQREVK